jgi:predicted dehydrogenase
VKSEEQINVALVGLGFGAEFIPIYLHHPNVASLTICDTDDAALSEWGNRYQVERRSRSLEAVLGSGEVDAVHLVTPVNIHAEQSIAVLEAGKHCACTIPMGLTIDELRAVIAAQRKAQKNYMMMETSVYTRELLYVRDLMERGELGTVTFVRGAHLQDMEGWPSYWIGFPPLVHITHAFAPALALLNTRATKVHCFGSGQLRDDLKGQYGNPFPFETAIFRLENTNVAAEVSRFMFQTARSYTESFAIYGEKKGFEWQQLEAEDPILFTLQPKTAKRGRSVTAERVKAPDRQDLLPKEIARFTQRGVYDASTPHLSFLQGGFHGGSHPHLVHEFVRSIIEGRESWINEVTAANWTAAGICAHESAMKDGELVIIPRFDED